MTYQGESMPGSRAPAPAPAEQVVVRLRRHARILFWPSLLLVACCGVTGYFAGELPESWQNLALLGSAAAVVLLLWLLPLVAWLSRRYTITTRRVIVRHGFFVRVRQELLHSRGYDVTVRKSWLQSAFGSGDVHVNAGLEKPIVLRDVPNADLVQKVLHDLMESNQSVMAARRQQEQSLATDQTVIWSQQR
ncbi:PH domain-containing protein [Luethyella okanaganae]|uniref:PH domain-containing protein n=1 Tax=Luethyella okanaganae TaxID=69372 RepID=A0ABW1VDN5_9MICO